MVENMIAENMVLSPTKNQEGGETEEREAEQRAKDRQNFLYDMYFQKEEIERISNQQNQQLFDELIQSRRLAKQPEKCNFLDLRPLTIAEVKESNKKKRVMKRINTEVQPMEDLSKQEVMSPDGSNDSEFSKFSLTEADKKLVEMDILQENIKELIDKKVEPVVKKDVNLISLSFKPKDRDYTSAVLNRS